MPVTAVLGLQWGDEGKGKIVDVLGENTDIVVRCQGGANAGHTVVIAGEIFALHLLPSGAVRDGVACVIGNGVVVDPLRLVDELSKLQERGIAVSERLLLSDRAHLVLPCHKILDGLREERRGQQSLGTTLQGIGPCYTDKVARVGLRWHHADDARVFPGLLRARLETANKMIASLGGEPLDPEAAAAEILPAVERLRPCITDTVAYLHQALDQDKNILLEGAQGAMLDIDFGTYPYLTSSNTTLGGCATGSGIPPTRIDAVHGVLKVFTTRVGAGPFPTELDNELGELLRGTGENQWDEYGTTTGRPRRCGWLDLVVGRYSTRVNGVTHLHLSKLDVLSEFAELKICTAYRLNGERVENYPASLENLARCEAEYETLPGWKTNIQSCREFADLPAAARAYVRRISEFLNVRIATVSFGPGRSQTLHCQ